MSSSEQTVQVPIESNDVPVVDTSVPETAAPVAVVSKQSLTIDKLLSKIDSLEEQLLNQKKGLDSALSTIKGLRKQVKKISTKSQKIKNKPKKSNKPHGFAVPSVVSDELCAFMGLEANSLVPRTVVTKVLTKYIDENKLQNPKNRREVFPDAKLISLLGEEAVGQTITYFTMQKYINRHFPKKQKEEVIVAPVV